MPKKPRSRKTPPPPVKAAPAKIELQPGDAPRVLLWLRMAGVVTLLAVLLAWWQPELRLWGLHHLAYLPVPLSLLLVGLAIFSWTPWGGKLADRILIFLPRILRKTWLVLCFAAVLFTSLRVAVPLLGDGALWIKELLWIGEYGARGWGLPDGRWLIRKEPLEVLSHEVVFRIVALNHPNAVLSGTKTGMEDQIKVREKWFHDSAQSVYQWMSIAAGIAAVWLALRFARRRLPETQWPLFLRVVLGSSATLLFFGYVEHYSGTFVWILACLLAGLDDTFPPRRFPWKTLICFGLAVGFHLAAIFLLPAVIYLVWMWRQRGDIEIFARPAGLILSGFAVIGLAGYVYVKGWKGWISVLPLTKGFSNDGYAFFTWIHGADLLNLAALVLLPAGVILLAVRSKSASPLGAIHTSFLSLAAICGAAFVSVFNPNLGMARDWDLLAVSLLPVLVLAAWIIAQLEWGEYRGEMIAALAGFGLLITIPFILVQAGERWSVARFETLLRLDRPRSAYGWENLAIYYEANNDLDNRLRAWTAAAEVNGNVRYKVNQGIALRLKNRMAEAETILVAAARENKKYTFQLIYLAQSYADQKNRAKVLEMAKLATELSPEDKAIAEFRRMVESGERE